MKRIIVAITGATGAIFGVRLLEELHKLPEVETHLIMSGWAEKTIEIETNFTLTDIKAMADVVHDIKNQGAAVASGSFRVSGMAVVPCSMKTLAAMAHGYADNLIVRAADVMLKERRKLVVVARETPLHAAHLENMLKLTNLGAIIMPPMPAFYNHPQTIDDLINHHVGRIFHQFDLESDLMNGWTGIKG